MNTEFRKKKKLLKKNLLTVTLFMNLQVLSWLQTGIQQKDDGEFSQ